jgi:hypothetical protein
MTTSNLLGITKKTHVVMAGMEAQPDNTDLILSTTECYVIGLLLTLDQSQPQYRQRPIAWVIGCLQSLIDLLNIDNEASQ